MLVLSRKLSEKIVIDKEIVVTILKIEGNKVRLGIEAPGTVSVLRQELLVDTKPERGKRKPALAAT